MSWFCKSFIRVSFRLKCDAKDATYLRIRVPTGALWQNGKSKTNKSWGVASPTVTGCPPFTTIEGTATHEHSMNTPWRAMYVHKYQHKCYVSEWWVSTRCEQVRIFRSCSRLPIALHQEYVMYSRTRGNSQSSFTFFNNEVVLISWECPQTNLATFKPLLLLRSFLGVQMIICPKSEW